MAGDWIKMRIELQSHPKIVRILSATQSDKFRAIGGLHAVWSVFDLHSENGKLHGYTPALMDHIIGWDGFSQAMVDVGWLLFDGSETLSMPEFTEHNGKSAKRRAEDQKRKRDERKCPQSVRNLSADESDENRTREEKRREEINTFVSSKLPTCPHQEILSLFADVLPELPQPRIWEGTREKNLASRWKWVMDDLKKKGKEQTKEAGLDFFRRMFGYIKESDFLMGRNASWSADLGWIVKGENFSKIIDGNYENKVAA